MGVVEYANPVTTTSPSPSPSWSSSVPYCRVEVPLLHHLNIPKFGHGDGKEGKTLRSFELWSVLSSPRSDGEGDGVGDGDGNFQVSIANGVMFGSAMFPIPDGDDDGDGNKDALKVLGESVYDELFHIIGKHNMNLFRIWNYFPHINVDHPHPHPHPHLHPRDRYQSFCFGRALGWAKCPTQRLTAATGIGTLGEPVLTLYFLAIANPISIPTPITSKHASTPVFLENPRQVPAYEYPVKYGPRPPSFARGTWIGDGDGDGTVYVSGTASIIGSCSMHFGNIEKQCEAMLKNISLLCGNENLRRHGVDVETVVAGHLHQEPSSPSPSPDVAGHLVAAKVPSPYPVSSPSLDMGGHVVAAKVSLSPTRLCLPLHCHSHGHRYRHHHSHPLSPAPYSSMFDRCIYVILITLMSSGIKWRHL